MAFIKEETQDFRIEEVFSLKQEDFEEQTGWFSFSMHLILIKILLWLDLYESLVVCDPLSTIYKVSKFVQNWSLKLNVVF